MRNTIRFIALSAFIFSASATIHAAGLKPIIEENPWMAFVILCISSLVYRITEGDV